MQITQETVVGITIEGRPVSWLEVTDAFSELKDRMKLTTGACSTMLLLQLSHHWCRIPASFGAAHPILVDVHEVIGQIGILEKSPVARVAPTGRAEPLDGQLAGLWHKHWFQAAFMLKNLRNEIVKNGNSLFHKRLNEHYGKNGWNGRLIDDEMVNVIAQAYGNDPLHYRVGGRPNTSRLTGEWIVFAKTKKRNIYLTLAGHEESNEEILNRCLASVQEFPELAESEPFRSHLA